MMRFFVCMIFLYNIVNAKSQFETTSGTTIFGIAIQDDNIYYFDTLLEAKKSRILCSLLCSYISLTNLDPAEFSESKFSHSEFFKSERYISQISISDEKIEEKENILIIPEETPRLLNDLDLNNIDSLQQFLDDPGAFSSMHSLIQKNQNLQENSGNLLSNNSAQNGRN